MKKLILVMVVLVLTTLIFGCISNEERPIGGDTDEGGCLIGAGYSYDESVGACTRNWELNESQKAGAKLAVDFVGSETGLTIIDVNVMKCVGCYEVKLVDSNNEQKLVEIINFIPSYKDLNNSSGYNYYEGLVEDFVVVYNEGSETIEYSFVVNKPTPCYEVKHEVLLMESYPVQVAVNVDLIPLQTFAACAEVITPEKVFRSIDLNHVPGSFRLNFNGEVIFTKNNIEMGGICSQEQKDAEVCTLQYDPVCGDDGQTYGNACSACSSKQIDYYLDGECQ